MEVEADTIKECANLLNAQEDNYLTEWLWICWNLSRLSNQV